MSEEETKCSDCAECSCCEETIEPIPEEEEDPTLKFDKTRGLRDKILEKVDNILKKATAGKKTDRKEMLLCLRQLFDLTASHEGLLRALMSDFLQMVQYVQTTERNTATLSLTMSALLKVLIDKQVLAEEDITNAWKSMSEKAMEEITEKKEEEAV